MIDRNDILRMARKVNLPDPMVFYASIERFATLVAAAEREACAQVCYRHAAFVVDPIDKERINQCAAAIRARGNT